MGPYLFKYLIPGMLLIAIGFLVASQGNVFLGLTGFLCFFVLGVALIVEGRKRVGKTK